MRAPLFYRRGACFGGHTPPRTHTHAHARIGGDVGCGRDVKAGRRVGASARTLGRATRPDLLRPSVDERRRETDGRERERTGRSFWCARASGKSAIRTCFFFFLHRAGADEAQWLAALWTVDGGRWTVDAPRVGVRSRFRTRSSVRRLFVLVHACLRACAAPPARACVSASVVGVYCRPRACLLACFDQRTHTHARPARLRGGRLGPSEHVRTSTARHSTSTAQHI